MSYEVKSDLPKNAVAPAPAYVPPSPAIRPGKYTCIRHKEDIESNHNFLSHSVRKCACGVTPPYSLVIFLSCEYAKQS